MDDLALLRSSFQLLSYKQLFIKTYCRIIKWENEKKKNQSGSIDICSTVLNIVSVQN